MKSQTLYRQCARMVMGGFPGKTAPAEFLQLASEGLFGAILFARNIESAPQVAELCRSLKASAPGPFMLAVDQEGGRVARLKKPPFTPLPPMRQLGTRGDVALLERVGSLLAFELRAVGFDWDFAPVLDVDTNPKNPVIGDRAFHSDANSVARFGLSVAKGLESSGVASCAKHFPGHGDTISDSHLTLPRLPHSLQRLSEVELVPFAAYARAGFASVMTAHVVFEALGDNLPATLSRRVLTDVLRTQLQFRGVVVSDDLEMKAIADLLPIEEAVALGAAAGVDLFLVCHSNAEQHKAIEGLVRAVETGRVSHARIAEANARLDALVSRFFRPAGESGTALGSPEHQMLAAGLSTETSGRDPTERLG